MRLGRFQLLYIGLPVSRSPVRWLRTFFQPLRWRRGEVNNVSEAIHFGYAAFGFLEIRRWPR